MNRRTFANTLLLGSAALLSSSTKNTYDSVAKKLLKPERLKKGDKVGLITPASYISDDGFQSAVEHLEALGLEVVLSKHIRVRNGDFAGTDQERIADVHQMFADPSIKAIWCARGGYGSARILPYLDYKLIRKNPKVFIGYSDITAMHIAIRKYSGLLTFHGPVASSELTDYTRHEVENILFNPQPNWIINLSEENQTKGQSNAAFKTKVLKEGIAQGELTGGNLSLLAASVGTAYAPDIRGKILLIEDIGEKPYRIDRMLTSLRQAWPMEKVAAIAMGVFNDCENKEGSQAHSLQQTLVDRLGDLNVPIIYGLSYGHISNMCTLPIGLNARLDTHTQRLTLLEAAVH